MLAALKLHPDSTCNAVTAISVDVRRSAPGKLVLRYSLSGKFGALVLPEISDPIRTDGLWQTSCFEAFLSDPESACYLEFNFSPSTQWAAYQFTDYRSGRREIMEITPPQCDVLFAEDCYVFQASLDLGDLLMQEEGIRWRLGLSAVIDERSGTKSYWALAHPPGKPDFHHRDCFNCELPIAE